MKYARVVDNIVFEVFITPAGFSIDECFTSELVAQFEQCPSEVEGGWIKQADGMFVAPSPITTSGTEE